MRAKVPDFHAVIDRAVAAHTVSREETAGVSTQNTPQGSRHKISRRRRGSNAGSPVRASHPVLPVALGDKGQELPESAAPHCSNFDTPEQALSPAVQSSKATAPSSSTFLLKNDSEAAVASVSVSATLVFVDGNALTSMGGNILQ